MCDILFHSVCDLFFDSDNINIISVKHNSMVKILFLLNQEIYRAEMCLELPMWCTQILTVAKLTTVFYLPKGLEAIDANINKYFSLNTVKESNLQIFCDKSMLTF